MLIDTEDLGLNLVVGNFVLASYHAYGFVVMFISADFPFMQAYYILDEILIAGELQESSKKNVARLIAAQVCILTFGQLIIFYFLENPLFVMINLECTMCGTRFCLFVVLTALQFFYPVIQ